MLNDFIARTSDWFIDFQDSACKSIVKKAAVHALVNKDLHDPAEVRALFCWLLCKTHDMGLFLLFLLLQLTTKTMERWKNIIWEVEPQRNFKVMNTLRYHSLVQLPSKAVLLFLQLLISFPTLPHPLSQHRCVCSFYSALLCLCNWEIIPFLLSCFLARSVCQSYFTL